MRIKCCDLDDAVAARVLEENVKLAWIKNPHDMFPYSVADFKRVGAWTEMEAYGDLLHSLFKASAGKLLRQKRLHTQVVTYVAMNGVVATDSDVERASYRLRLMMSQLRDARMSSRILPATAVRLSRTMREIDVTPSSSSEDLVAELGSCPEQLEVIEISDTDLESSPTPISVMRSSSDGEDKLDVLWRAMFGELHRDLGRRRLSCKTKVGG